MIGPGAYVDYTLSQAEFPGHKPVCFGATDEAPAQLILLPGAPGVDRTVGGEGEDVVGSGCKLLHFLELGYKGWSRLDLGRIGEAEDAFIALVSPKLIRDVHEPAKHLP
jgi:hypothetical protein